MASLSQLYLNEPRSIWSCLEWRPLELRFRHFFSTLHFSHVQRLAEFYLQFVKMRRLSLHTSALSDDEYDLYTSSLNEIALADEDPNSHDDAYYETMVIGVREARAWLRGRYSHIAAAKIDAVRATVKLLLTLWLIFIIDLEILFSNFRARGHNDGRSIFCSNTACYTC